MVIVAILEKRSRWSRSLTASLAVMAALSASAPAASLRASFHRSAPLRLAGEAHDRLTATISDYLTIHQRIDSDLADPTRADGSRRAALALQDLDRISKALEAIPFADVDRQDQIDAALLEHLLAADRHRADLLARAREELDAYVPGAIGLLEQLEPAETEAPSSNGKPAASPQDDPLSALKACLGRWQPERTIADPHLDRARQAVQLADRLAHALEAWSTRADGRPTDRQAEIDAAVSRAIDLLSARRHLIDSSVIPPLEATERWGRPIGRDELVFLLRNRHWIDDSPEDLIKLGRTQLDRIHAEMKEAAHTIDPKHTLAEVLEAMSEDHPTAEGLPDLARREMFAARDFVIAKGLITIPADCREGETVITAGDTNRTYPFGGYGGRQWRDDHWVGRYLVSPPTDEMSPTERAERLRGNDVYWTRVVATHEMWPGHHLQGVLAAAHARPIRLAYHTTVFSEGWGLYSEQLLYEHGYFDAKTHLAQLKMQAWRAARVIIDVELQCGQMSFEDAVAFLVEEVAFERENAEAEVRRYIGNPTRPLSYMVGFLQIMALRDAVQAARGRDFDLRAFHDELLTYGSIPIQLIRYGMTGEGKIR